MLIMKQLVKRAFSLAGLGVYRLGASQDSKRPPKPVVSSPLHHNSKEGLNQFYSDEATVESYLDHGFYQRLVSLLRDEGFDYDGKNVADIGCGTGGLLKSIQFRFKPASLTGFEYSEGALNIARSKIPGVKFDYLDVYEGTSLQFDALFCVEVLEHLLYPDQALTQVVGMLAPSGVALVTVPNGRIDTFEGHINFWSPESWSVFLNNLCDGYTVKTGAMEDDKHIFAIIKRKSVQAKR